ncbi:Carboxylic acid transporter protein [Wickerhamomyces ciferrii]|uniref:Carboxylic acid transporter protein n=1 Tax=Wickerhamomyces ciferrii (strain ATCC 14091 / BCRC 22168 / CBS 111 / JCM 3599 / NBRC 0793 / NRRL Y-1031 F-60-10) TaxID=1206466 RepID=K0KYT2_WICCF|nr:Carboxylic acid transporter protein [Wickerhamomyces ciferrii]CCH46564.1 Carboxylic acid transporter protein [Wickerhamomyces ciferrii]
MTQSIGQYVRSRIPTLFKLQSKSLKPLNPIPAFRAMSRSDWNFFMMGYMAWTVDAFDFFCTSVTATAVAKTLNRSVTDITWGITLVLMFRSLGAVIFGFISDTYGRKPAYLICCFLFCVFEIGTGFIQTYAQFLVLRGLFGMSMGGMYAAAAATSLENAPVQSRSVLSGIFLPGYNLGYIFAIIFFRAFEFTTHGWRALFWFSAAPPAMLFVWRLFFPESPFFIEHRRLEKEKLLNQGDSAKANSPVKQFFGNLKNGVKKHWLLFVYLIFLMSGMNFSSHGSQDLFPTMLQKQIKLNPDQRTVTMVVVNLGAMCGGLIMGQVSEITGRRLALVICCVIGSVLIYPTFFSDSQAQIMGAGFFMQAAVMGAWGILPIHLIELSPPEFRSLFSGLAYQLGNLVSSASSTIEADATEQFPLPEKGPDVHDYGKVMALFMTGVFIFLLICVIVGPEYFHRDLSAGAENDKDVVIIEGNDELKNQSDTFNNEQESNSDQYVSSEFLEIDQDKPITHHREHGYKKDDNIV